MHYFHFEILNICDFPEERKVPCQLQEAEKLIASKSQIGKLQKVAKLNCQAYIQRYVTYQEPWLLLDTHLTKSLKCSK